MSVDALLPILSSLKLDRQNTLLLTSDAALVQMIWCQNPLMHDGIKE